MTAAPPVIDSEEHPIADLPFPVTSFPPDVAAWLEATAAHVRVPVAFVAFPFLALAGAVLGNQISLQLNPRWVEHAALWVALVAPSGHGKAPALAAARAPFESFHKGGGDNGDQALIDSILDELALLREMPEDQRPPEDEAPVDHEEPVRYEPLELNLESEASPFFTATSRLDALARLLLSSCGICLLRDELASLIHTIDRGHTEDHQTLLSLWSSEPLYPSHPNLAPVLNPVLAIVGGFQPGVFRRFRSSAQDGLLERFLLVHPGLAAVACREPEDDSTDDDAIHALVQSLRPIGPAVVNLSPDAAAAWRTRFALNGAVTVHRPVPIGSSGIVPFSAGFA